MKKIIITGAIICVLAVGGGLAANFAIEYNRTNYAKEASEAAARLEDALNNYKTKEEIQSDLAGASTAEVKEYMRTNAASLGVKLKDLSKKELEKLKEKNEKLKTEMQELEVQIKAEELGSDKFDQLMEKYHEIEYEQTECELQINYNEL